MRTSLLKFSKRSKRLLARLYHDESGQGTAEYILILSATVWGVSALARTLLSTLDQGILRIGSQLEQDLKTGRAPLSVWQN